MAFLLLSITVLYHSLLKRITLLFALNMKRLIIPLFPLLLVGCASEDYSYVVKPVNNETHYDDVYLIMGQSNATGVAEWRFLEEKAPKVWSW